MAFVKVTPYYAEGNPKPIEITFNELIHEKKKKKPEEYIAEDLTSYVEQEELL